MGTDGMLHRGLHPNAGALTQASPRATPCPPDLRQARLARLAGALVVLHPAKGRSLLVRQQLLAKGLCGGGGPAAA